MKTLSIAIAMAALACTLATAQKLDLDFNALAAKATAKSEVTLDANALQMLRQAGPLAKKDDKGKGGDVGKMLAGIQEVVIRNYEFAQAGAYSDRDLEPLRGQLRTGSGWSRIVNVKEKEESTEIYVSSQDGKPNGMLLISAEAKELTIVHISGMVQLAQLKDVVNSVIHYDLASVGAASAQQ